MNTQTTADTSSPAPKNWGEGAATGPRTDDGKRVAARNATTHGLFARDVVLPHLGEDPRGYETFLSALAGQLQPKNMLEQHYVEKIAAASWRLRRLQRWQAQLFEDPDITEDEALSRLDRVMRHETALHRQIDTSIKMLGREIPKLFQDPVRAYIIADLKATEKELREDPLMNDFVVSQTCKRIPSNPIPDSLKDAPLDAAPAPQDQHEPNCQNEPSLPSPLEGEGRSLATGERISGERSAEPSVACRYSPDPPLAPKVKQVTIGEEQETRQKPGIFGICQNEPAPDLLPRSYSASSRCGRTL